MLKFYFRAKENRVKLWTPAETERSTCDPCRESDGSGGGGGDDDDDDDD